MRRGLQTTLFAGLCLALIPGCAATDDPAGAARKAAHQTGRAITWPFRKLAEHNKARKEAAEVPISTVSAGATEEKPILADGSEKKDKDGSARLASARKDEVRIDSDPDDEPAPRPKRKRTPTVETSDPDDAEEEAPPPRRKRADPIIDGDAGADSDGDRPARNPSWKSKGGSRSASASSDKDTIRIE